MKSLATALARAALGADAARARSDHLVGTAVGTNDAHVGRAQREPNAVRLVRQLRHWSIDCGLFHLGQFRHRQLGLSGIWRCGIPVALNELAAKPAKHIVRNAKRSANMRVSRESARLESLISKLSHQLLQRD